MITSYLQFLTFIGYFELFEPRPLSAILNNFDLYHKGCLYEMTLPENDVLRSHLGINAMSMCTIEDFIKAGF